jgi:Holliday junction resolvase RusA-like endonuclease
MSCIRFEVVGRAQQKGSARAFVVKGKNSDKPRAVVTSTNTNAKHWEADVRYSAALVIPREHELWTGAVAVAVMFVMPRPKSLKEKWAPYLKVPDLDKLLRCIGDACTNLVYRDDAQIVFSVQHKRYARPGEGPRALVTVWRPSGDELMQWEHSIEPPGPIATDGREPAPMGALF